MRYFREDWGFPFITGFIILLVVAAIILAAGRASVAELVATGAYFALVVGVVLQLVCYGRNRLKNGAVSHGSS